MSNVLRSLLTGSATFSPLVTTPDLSLGQPGIASHPVRAVLDVKAVSTILCSPPTETPCIHLQQLFDWQPRRTLAESYKDARA
ncbi:hypothetical protein [Spirosoma jeollabukense]